MGWSAQAADLAWEFVWGEARQLSYQTANQFIERKNSRKFKYLPVTSSEFQVRPIRGEGEIN
jgi:hypothetical protein